MPRPLKSDEDRQRRNVVGLGLVLVPETTPDSPEAADRPPPDHRWLAASKKAWVELWASEMVQAYNPVTDIPALRRLFGLRDQRERYQRLTDSDPVVEGSKGQPVSHPLLAEIQKLDPEIRQLEDRFGLNPKARASLGIKFGQRAKTIADLNRKVEDEPEDDRWDGLDADGEDV